MSAAARFRGTDLVSTGRSGHSSRPAYFEPEIDSALADGGQIAGRGADNCAEIRACNTLIAEHGADFEDQVGRSLRLSDIEFLTVRSATGAPEAACLSCQSVLVRRGATDPIEVRRMRESELMEFLSSFGWEVAGARRDTEVIVAGLERVGFAGHQEARSFLGKYLDLKIGHLPALVIAGERISSWTHFDPSPVCTARDADVARRCAEVAGTALFPIGVDSFHLTVYSGSSGRFYAGFDSSVYQYGEDCNAMFSMMKTGVRPILLGEWTLQ